MKSNSERKPTINDVARVAGVSRQTVSRVLNGGFRVAPETFSQVSSAIAELGYRPNAVARSFVTRRTHTILVITERFAGTISGRILEGIESYCRSNGYNVLLSGCRHSDNGEPLEAPELNTQRAEGIIIRYAGASNDSYDVLNSIPSDTPIVTAGYGIGRSNVFPVATDNTVPAAAGLNYLIDKGHRRIALVEGPVQRRDTEERHRGCRLAAESSSRDVELFVESSPGWAASDGYKAVSRLLDTDKRFSAVFTHSDDMAIGAIRALHDRGLHVPSDVAVMGFNDMPSARYILPSLTTIRNPAFEGGQLFAKACIRLIEGTPEEDVLLPEEQAPLSFSVISRESA